MLWALYAESSLSQRINKKSEFLDFCCSPVGHLPLYVSHCDGLYVIPETTLLFEVLAI